MIPQLKIHVDGHGSVFRTAERGVLHISVSSQNASKAQSSQDVQDTMVRMTASFRSHATKTATSGITTFTASALTTSSFIPSEYVSGRKRPYTEADRIYTTTMTYEVVFRDLDLLADTANELASMPFVSITRTEWRLTDATRDELERDARKKAIQKAVQKAEDYAAIVGRKVVAIEIKDGPSSYSAYNPFIHMPMMQQQQQMQMQAQAQAHAQQMAQSASAAAQASVNGPSVEPRTISASAQVQALFVSIDGDAMEE